MNAFSNTIGPPMQPPLQARPSKYRRSGRRSFSMASSTRLTLSMPSTASASSSFSAVHSPPERAQPIPRGEPCRAARSVCFSFAAASFSRRSWLLSSPYTSSMDMAPSAADFPCPMGERIAVALAAQGVIKKQPTSAGSTPFLSQNSRRAMAAAASIGERTSTMLSRSSGKRT